MQLKKRILIICPFPQGVAAGQRLKYEQYFDDWAENGYDVVVSNFMDNALWEIAYSPGKHIQKFFGVIRGYYRRIKDLRKVKEFDFVYIFMWVTPFGSTFFERMIRLLAGKIIYDIEDNILVSKGNKINPLAHLLKGQGKTKFLIRTADHVITSSPFLNDYCANLKKKNSCTYITSSVDTNIFIPTNEYRNEGKITLGWTGTFSSRPYLDLLRETLIKLNAQCDFKLRVIGNFDYELPGIDLEVIRWSKKTEVKDLQEIDIGLYPLTRDEFVLGKSGLKAIQYMAFGIPTVATNYGTTPLLIEHMKNGWLVNSDDEWITALKTLIHDPKLRCRLGKNARKTVLNRYSVSAVASQYLNILDSFEEVQ